MLSEKAAKRDAVIKVVRACENEKRVEIIVDLLFHLVELSQKVDGLCAVNAEAVYLRPGHVGNVLPVESSGGFAVCYAVAQKAKAACAVCHKLSSSERSFGQRYRSDFILSRHTQKVNQKKKRKFSALCVPERLLSESVFRHFTRGFFCVYLPFCRIL